MDALGQAKHVLRSHEGGLHGLYRVVLVVHRRGGAGQVVNLVDFCAERLGDVVPDELEVWFRQKIADVFPARREEVVQAYDVVPLVDEPSA